MEEWETGTGMVNCTKTGLDVNWGSYREPVHKSHLGDQGDIVHGAHQSTELPSNFTYFLVQ